MILEVIFWLLLFFVFYAYLGYPVVIYLIAKIKNDKHPENTGNTLYEPDVTLFVTAYNESSYVIEKVLNSFDLDYPADKLQLVWVTDGSTDDTNALLANYPRIKRYFEPERKGKINAMNRGMDFVDSEIVIFSDANTLLSKETIREMVSKFRNKQVGCIAGEKRILVSKKEDAASAGEGIYWQYESWIKKNDAISGSCIGAAGELFAVRRSLFQKVKPDTILDDFVISLNIAMQGYKIDYSPKAYAIEKASADMGEEMKRKVRIAAGSIQSLVRLVALLNIFKYKFLSFQYISHKVMRWVVTPVSLTLLVPLNIYLYSSKPVFALVLLVHSIFYIMVFLGWAVRYQSVKHSFIFVPYYFFMANLAMVLGFIRYVRGTQTVNWARARRAD